MAHDGGRDGSDKRQCLLELPPTLESLADLRLFVDSSGLAEYLTPERIFDLKVAVSEAAANAIEHAKAEVGIVLWLLGDRVIAEVTSPGVFGSSGNAPLAPRRATRGFGLRLMVSLANEVTFSRGQDGGTVVRLTFLRERFPGEPAATAS